MITCSSCGTSLADNARFCRMCGRPVASAEVQPQGIKLPNGVYTGEMANGMPHGMGKLVSNDGRLITYGMWDRGEVTDLCFVSSAPRSFVGLDVLGEETTLGATIYSAGRYVEGVLSLRGDEPAPNFVGRVVGRDYEGSYDCPWSEGGLTGHGTFRGIHGMVYEGDFINWQFCGQGVLRLPSGTVYEGEFRNNRLNGHVVCTLESGSRFEGRCVDGYASGQGVFHGQGYVYEGAWDKGRFHGQGKLTASGWSYVGQFREGLRSGDGVYAMSEGKYVYQGEWRKDKFHGSGSLKCADGTWYKGRWSNGEPTNGMFIQSTMSESFDWDKTPRPTETPEVTIQYA